MDMKSLFRKIEEFWRRVGGWMHSVKYLMPMCTLDVH